MNGHDPPTPPASSPAVEELGHEPAVQTSFSNTTRSLFPSSAAATFSVVGRHQQTSPESLRIGAQAAGFVLLMTACSSSPECASLFRMVPFAPHEHCAAQPRHDATTDEFEFVPTSNLT